MPPSPLDAVLTPEDAELLFGAMLRRPIRDDAYRDGLVAGGVTVRQLIEGLRACDELRGQVYEEALRAKRDVEIDPMHYRVPRDLARTEVHPRRVLMVGSCLMATWTAVLEPIAAPCAFDLFLTGGELPAAPPHPIGDYDFQVIHLPLRSIIGDAAFARLPHTDLAAHQALFDASLAALRHLLFHAMVWNAAHGLLTFVLPLIAPQQNPVGRLLPRYDLRNPVYYIEKLNEALAEAVASRPNAYVLDMNDILATQGRRLAQEDVIAALNHGALINDFDFVHDFQRIEPPVHAASMFDQRPDFAIAACWHELIAMFRTVKQIDMVKLVIIDLDDTLWRGTIADTPVHELPTNEGRPKGFWEALLFLKRRGILLAIVSRNDETNVRAAWPHILGYDLSLDDFAATRINWASKSANIAEILAELNLLAANTVFIDDHPVQRAEVAAAFPDMRVLSGNPLSWRRILLWSAETQLAAITAESAARTTMVRAQQAREADRVLDPAAFHATLGLRMTLFTIVSTEHPRFARALELINKTNQWNTTGQRWTLEQCRAAFAEDVTFHAFDLVDKYTAYGLVGVLIVGPRAISQFVMSCRVMGLGAERAAIGAVLDIVRQAGRASVEALVTETERNLPCREVYAQCGFEKLADGLFERATAHPEVSPHIAVTVAPEG